MADFVDHDPWTGVSTYHEYDSSSKKTKISHHQNVEKLLDSSKSLQNDESYKRRGIKEDFYHIGRVPLVVALEWKEKHGVDILTKSDPDTMRRVEILLSSPDYKYLRTVNRI